MYSLQASEGVCDIFNGPFSSPELVMNTSKSPVSGC